MSPMNRRISEVMGKSSSSSQAAARSIESFYLNRLVAVLFCELLGRWGVCGKTWWLSGEGRKSSSMSSTFASRDFEEFSFMSISFILFWIRIVFRVIFSPGRDILNSQGIHWRKRIRTCRKKNTLKNIFNLDKFVYFTQFGILWVSESRWW